MRNIISFLWIHVFFAFIFEIIVIHYIIFLEYIFQKSFLSFLNFNNKTWIFIITVVFLIYNIYLPYHPTQYWKLREITWNKISLHFQNANTGDGIFTNIMRLQVSYSFQLNHKNFENHRSLPHSSFSCSFYRILPTYTSFHFQPEVVNRMDPSALAKIIALIGSNGNRNSDSNNTSSKSKLKIIDNSVRYLRENFHPY